MSIRLRWSQYMGFITIGIIASITGPLLSAIKADINMSYSKSGLILSGQCIGILLTVFLGGHIADRYGKKPFLIIGGGILSAGLIGVMLSGNFISLFLCTILTGIGFGTYEAGINALCSDSSESDKGNAMNFLHFFYGAGAMSGPIIASVCLEYFKNWRVTYGICAVLPVIVFFLLKSVEIKNDSKDHTAVQTNHYKSWIMWVSAFYLLIYVGIEMSLQGWLTTFWKSVAPKSFISASLIVSIFWFSLTFGRLISGRLADKIGMSRFLAFASFGTMILACLWMFARFPAGMVLIILCMGAFLAGIFPTLMASAISYYPGMSGVTTGFITTFASIGGFVGPTAIGRIADSVGISELPRIIFVLAVLLFAVAFYRDRLDRKVRIK